ncbi:unnamed protein product [Ectocarpus sp. CCAP 1310/34]|nr:unnamed protein product [Ectocarpus sp. CCAP 1310/34]
MIRSGGSRTRRDMSGGLGQSSGGGGNGDGGDDSSGRSSSSGGGGGGGFRSSDGGTGANGNGNSLSGDERTRERGESLPLSVSPPPAPPVPPTAPHLQRAPATYAQANAVRAGRQLGKSSEAEDKYMAPVDTLESTEQGEETVATTTSPYLRQIGDHVKCSQLWLFFVQCQ